MRAFSCAVLALVSGCAYSEVSDLESSVPWDANARAPNQVAIAPVRVTVRKPSVFWYLGRPLVWLAKLLRLNFRSMPSAKRGSELVRDLVYLSLDQAGTGVRPVPNAVVSAATRKGAKTSAELAAACDADSVLELELYEWGSVYWVLQTKQKVGVRARLVDAAGRELARVDVLAIDGAGVLQGPTGYISLAAAPLAGIDDVPVVDLSADVAALIAQVLEGARPKARSRDDLSVQLDRFSVLPFSRGLCEVRAEARSVPDARVSLYVEGLSRPVRMIERVASPAVYELRFAAPSSMVPVAPRARVSCERPASLTVTHRATASDYRSKR